MSEECAYCISVAGGFSASDWSKSSASRAKRNLVPRLFHVSAGDERAWERGRAHTATVQHALEPKIDYQQLSING